MRRRAALLLAAMLLVTLSGCGRGDDVPLTAPGQPGIWPADGRWTPVPWLFADFEARDGAWDPGSSPAAPTVVVVGSAGRLMVHGPAGWREEGAGAGHDLARVLCLGPDEFLAVGSGGTVVRRYGGTWHAEDAGTTADLEYLVHEGGTTWVGSPDGTLRQHGPAAWRDLPSPGSLSGLAHHGGALVVGRSGSDSLGVWRDDSWRPLAPGPWAGHPVRGVAAAAGVLVVAADSVYAHDGERWRTAIHSLVRPAEEVRLRVSPLKVRWRTRAPGESWHQEHWEVRVFADEPWGLPTLGSSFSGAEVELADDRRLVIDANGRVRWYAPDAPRRDDPAGNWTVYAEAAVPGVGLILTTSVGVLGVDGRTVRVLAGTEVYEQVGSSYVDPVGESFEEFYLLSRSAAAFCSGGSTTLLSYPAEVRSPDTGAIDGTGRLHIADNAGVWRFEGGGWARVLPVDGIDGGNCDVWSVGDGRLAARVHREMWLIDGDRRIPLGNLGPAERPVAGADGVPFLLRETYFDYWGSAVNSLHVWDARRGVLREIGTRGMGILVDADVGAVYSDPRGPLFVTRSPIMIFTLVGSPLEADWRLLAGPGPTRIEAVVRLADGSLLALDNSDRGLHLYRP